MARAGFAYTPQESGDDLATCLYCNTSLSGWDEDDDPMYASFHHPTVEKYIQAPLLDFREEHRKRVIKSNTSCSFLEHTESQHTKPRTTASKPPSKSNSKPPSRSASRTKYQDVVVPTKTYDGEIEDESDAPKPRSRSASRTSSAKTPKRKMRSTSRSGLKDVVEENEDEQVVVPPLTTKKTRSRSKSVARSEVTLRTDDEGEVSLSRKPSRSRAKSKAPVQEEPEEEEPARKSSRSKTKASSDDTVGVNEKPHRPSRKSSKPRPAEQEEEEEEKPEIATAKRTKATKSKKTASRSKSKAPPAEDDSESDPIMPAASIAKSSSTVHKANGQTQSLAQIPEAKDLFNEDVVVINDLIPPPSSTALTPQPSMMELPPLFVPKRLPSAKLNSLNPIASKGSKASIIVTSDKENEKRRHGRPLKAKSNVASEQGNDEGAAMMTSSKPPSRNGRDETSQKPKKTTKIVEVSSDEDEEEFSVRRGKSEGSSGKLKENATQNVDTDQVFQSQPQVVMEDKMDMSVDYTQQAELGTNLDVEMPSAPSTPPRSLKGTFLKIAGPKDARSPPSLPQKSDLSEKLSAPAEPDFVPPLSRLPFMPLHTLSEAELDMTVEEWIRYQIEVEQDRFKRDGERELERFRKRAEEVRNAIESL